MYNIKFKGDNAPVVIHGWEIPEGAVYNADPAEPFVCLCPSPKSYASYIWRYMGKDSGGGWQKNSPPKEIKLALRDFIINNHLTCSCSIDSSPPGYCIGSYDIKVKRGEAPVVIRGWEIPEGAIYNADPKNLFVCLYPSLAGYFSYIWRYFNTSSGKGWKCDNNKNNNKAVHDFIIDNHLDCSCAIDSSPPEYYRGPYRIKVKGDDDPVVIHGWEIPEGAIYNIDNGEPFVCLFPSPEFYGSYIWRYIKKGKKGWRNDEAPKKIKESLYAFIIDNHLDCSCAIDSTPPKHCFDTYDDKDSYNIGSSYDIKIMRDSVPVEIHGWKIPEGAVYNADSDEPFVCLFPSVSNYSSYIWRYSSKKKGWERRTNKKINNAVRNFLIDNHLNCFSAIDSAPPASAIFNTRSPQNVKKISARKKRKKDKTHKSQTYVTKRTEGYSPKTCIICGQPSFMGSPYCYNCYQQYVERRKK